MNQKGLTVIYYYSPDSQVNFQGLDKDPKLLNAATLEQAEQQRNIMARSSSSYF
jgi:hypothetical protein